MTAACNALDPNRRATLRKLRAVCSYAHHNAKVNKRTPTYPLLTPAQRLLHPPVYQNIIRVDERTNAESLYGFSSAVCAVVDEDAAVSTADLDRYDLDGEEDASVRALMYENLLPFATGPEFTYRHKWSDGDLVIWDNLRTIHTATPFEERYEREMWRTTVAHEAGGEAYLGASIG
jgi:alpha-ketoglutarate-dependent taurine dioxygenase